MAPAVEDLGPHVPAGHHAELALGGAVEDLGAVAEGGQGTQVPPLVAEGVGHAAHEVGQAVSDVFPLVVVVVERLVAGAVEVDRQAGLAVHVAELHEVEAADRAARDDAAVVGAAADGVRGVVADVLQLVVVPGEVEFGGPLELANQVPALDGELDAPVEDGGHVVPPVREARARRGGDVHDDVFGPLVVVGNLSGHPVVPQANLDARVHRAAGLPAEVGVGRLEWEEDGLPIVEDAVVGGAVRTETGVVREGGVSGAAPARAGLQETELSAFEPRLVADDPAGAQRGEETVAVVPSEAAGPVHPGRALEEVAVLQRVVGTTEVGEEAVLGRVVDRGLAVGHLQQAVVLEDGAGHVAEADAVSVAVRPLEFRTGEQAELAEFRQVHLVVGRQAVVPVEDVVGVAVGIAQVTRQENARRVVDVFPDVHVIESTGALDEQFVGGGQDDAGVVDGAVLGGHPRLALANGHGVFRPTPFVLIEVIVSRQGLDGSVGVEEGIGAVDGVIGQGIGHRVTEAT